MQNGVEIGFLYRFHWITYYLGQISENSVLYVNSIFYDFNIFEKIQTFQVIIMILVILKWMKKCVSPFYYF